MTQPASGRPHPLEGLIEENLMALAQLKGLLDDLPPDAYRQPFGADGRHTLGKHVRHIIDHYDALLGGLEAGGTSLDYEHRRRDEVLEQWPARAAQRVTDLEAALLSLADQTPPASLALAYPVGEESLALSTSLDRELAFLTSHTIHHMAILGLLAEPLGLVLPESFGVHPSTLRHWQREALPVMAEGA